MTRDTKIVYGMVTVSVIVVGAYILLWNMSTKKFRSGKSTTQIERHVDRDIEMLDADGEARHLTDLNGKVWLVSHVFTRCPGQCAGICAELDSIYDEVKGSGPFHMVSVSLDPGHDKPENLKEFVEKHALVRDDWWFLTGEPSTVNKYMREVFLLAAQEIPEEKRTSEFDLFEHQAMVVLIDHELRMRGWYYPFDSASNKELRADLKQALAEAKKAARSS